MAKESARLMGRNGEIWRKYISGATQVQLAEEYGIAQSAISDAIRNVRDSIPNQERRDLINEMVDYLRSLRVQATEIAALPAPPIVAGQHAEYVRDPDTGNIARDYSGRLNAMSTAVRIAKEEINLLGLNAEMKVQINEGEEQAARKASMEAMSYLHGGTSKEEE